MRLRSYGLLLGVMALGTCAFTLSNYALTLVGTPFDPPAHYRAIYQQAEACTGKTGNFDKLQWREMPGRNWTCEDTGAPCIGHFDRPHTITLAHDWENTDWVVKHEMLHDLVGPHPENDSLNTEIWGRQCHATWGWLESPDSTYVP